MRNFIILTSTADHLAASLKEKLKNFELVFPEKNKEGQRCFPDGEVYMRLSQIDDLKKGRVVVLHAGTPDTNTGLMELELILQILKDHSISPEVFFTYFPYGRQDKVFEVGETNVAENLVKKLINHYGVKKIYAIDAHFGETSWVKEYPIENLSALPFLVKKSQEDFGPEVSFLSPDKGGKRRTGLAGLDKQRINSFEVIFSSSTVSMDGRVIGVVDDMIETGGTLLRFCELAKSSGAKNVVALITHGVLDEGVKKVKEKCSKLYLTNTINREEANVDITGLIAETII